MDHDQNWQEPERYTDETLEDFVARIDNIGPGEIIIVHVEIVNE